MIFLQPQAPLIEAEELLRTIGQSNRILLDVSPSGNKSGLTPRHPGRKIEGAIEVDLKTHFSKRDANLPNMAPSAEAFAEQLHLLGIDRNTNVIIYDNLGIYSAPRLWWLFRIMGYERVRVLNGGLDAWSELGGKMEARVGLATVGNVGTTQHSDKSQHAIWSRTDIQSNLQSAQATVVDARSAGRFAGTAPEPRPGWPSGHIPQSVNVPFKTLLNGGKYLPASACLIAQGRQACLIAQGRQVLKKKLSAVIPADGPLVFSCGSGLTACIVLLAVAMHWPDRELYLYDGSWVEWADPQGEGFPIATV